MPRTLTSTNSVFTLSVKDTNGRYVYRNQKIDGFATDDAFSLGAKQTGVGMVGVDGKFSYAYTPSTTEQNVTLQADSPSIDLFDAIYKLQENAREAYTLEANIQVPATRKSYALSSGVLTSYTPMPDHKQTLSPQSFTIVWGKVTPSRF